MTIKLPSLRVHAYRDDATKVLQHAYRVVGRGHATPFPQSTGSHGAPDPAGHDTDGWQRHLMKKPR